MEHLDSAWIAASVGAFTGVLGAIVTLFVNERRARRDFRLELSAEALARELLMHPQWRLRGFATLKRHLGGFGDDELRQILVRAGAVRFESDDGTEWWGLVARNRALLAGEEKLRRRSERGAPAEEAETNATIIGRAPAQPGAPTYSGA
jgi:hypothetical protein